MIPKTPEGMSQPEFLAPSEPSGSGPIPPRELLPDEDDAAGECCAEWKTVAVEVEHLVRDGVEQVERRIRRHPLAAVSIAAGIGLVFGMLLRRRH